MPPKETKFSYAYELLKGRITNGELLPGSRVPSAQRICDELHVGLYTATKVLHALQEEGLIEIQRRKAPVVSQNASSLGPAAETLSVLKKRDSVLQVYQTVKLLLPDILAFCSQDCEIETLIHYKHAVKVAKNRFAAGGWRGTDHFLKDVMDTTGNPLFGSIYVAFQLYGSLTFFTEKCPYFIEQFLAGGPPSTGQLLEVLKSRDLQWKYTQLQAHYQRVADTVENTLQWLARECPAVPASCGEQFSWKPNRGREYRYAQIVQELTFGIGTGVYPCGSMLPSEGKLAQQYGVSVSTVRCALAVLEKRAYTKTLNGKGTMVVLLDDTQIAHAQYGLPDRREVLQYMHALQLMAVITRPVALYAAARIGPEDIAALAEKFQNPHTVWLNDLYLFIRAHLDLEPLQTILEEATWLTNWGYYLANYSNRRQELQHLNQMTLEAFTCLQNRDFEGFADGFSNCYRRILERVRNYASDKYRMHEVLSVSVPQPLPYLPYKATATVI